MSDAQPFHPADGVPLAALNGMDQEMFTTILGGVFEHSPWVAERAWHARPFATVDALHAAMLATVGAASRADCLALLRAHPELAGREAVEGRLTPDSSTEQGRLGFATLTRTELERIAQLNRAYASKFGFPAIVALARHHSRETVLAEIAGRTANGIEAEIANGLAQVAHVTRARLAKLVLG